MEKDKKGYTFRKFMNDIHLWVGIGSGIILFIICFTGTMYVFTKEITQWVDSDKFNVVVPANKGKIPVTQLVASLEAEKKDSKVTGINIPEGSEKAWFFTLTPKDIIQRRAKENKEKEKREKEGKAEGKEGRKRGERSEGKQKERAEGKIAAGKENGKGVKPGEEERRKKGMGDRERIKTYLVNPYTGQIQGDARTPTSKFFNTVMGLHRWLLLDHDIGRPITGVATILFILIEITGLILWLPAKIKSWKKWNAWKAGFKIKTDANWKRINHDLHNSLGFYTFLLITLMALTGLTFSFEWFREGVGYVFGAKPFEERKEAPLLSAYSGAKPFDLDAVISNANTVFPYGGNIRLSMPKDSVGTISITKSKDGFISSAGTDRVILEQYTGRILKTEKFSDKKTGEQIVALIYPLHVGEVFGTITKIIYFIACLIATSLPVTGTIIWINKLRKKPKKKAGVPGKHKDKARQFKVKVPQLNFKSLSKSFNIF